MEVNILPQAVVGNVVLLQGGGARVTIPPGNGFTITVNPVEFAAAGALGAGAGEGAANNIAAITGVFFFQFLNQRCFQFRFLLCVLLVGLVMLFNL